VYGDDDTGQNDFTDTGSPVSGSVSDQMDFGDTGTDTGTDTGNGVSVDGTNPQVNDGYTGNTGQRPMYFQNENTFTRPTGPGRCDECHSSIKEQGHAPDCTANNEEEPF
jgi:hypothetical protein